MSARLAISVLLIQFLVKNAVTEEDCNGVARVQVTFPQMMDPNDPHKSRQQQAPTTREFPPLDRLNAKDSNNVDLIRRLNNLLEDALKNRPTSSDANVFMEQVDKEHDATSKLQGILAILSGNEKDLSLKNLRREVEVLVEHFNKNKIDNNSFRRYTPSTHNQPSAKSAHTDGIPQGYENIIKDGDTISKSASDNFLRQLLHPINPNGFRDQYNYDHSPKYGRPNPAYDNIPQATESQDYNNNYNNYNNYYPAKPFGLGHHPVYPHAENIPNDVQSAYPYPAASSFSTEAQEYKGSNDSESKVAGGKGVIVELILEALKLIAGGDGRGLLKPLLKLPLVIIRGLIKSVTYTITKGGLRSFIARLLLPVLVIGGVNGMMIVMIWWMWDDGSTSHESHEEVYAQPQYGYRGQY